MENNKENRNYLQTRKVIGLKDYQIEMIEKQAADLGKPIWLDANIGDFKRHRKTRFLQDSFVEQVDFDYLEIQIIEED